MQTSSHQFERKAHLAFRWDVCPWVFAAALLMSGGSAHGQYSAYDATHSSVYEGHPVDVAPAEGGWPVVSDQAYLGTGHSFQASPYAYDPSAPLVEGIPCYPTNYETWGWEILPDGLIYRSYMAGPRESKMQLNMLQEMGQDETLWDVTLGGRRGLLRHGSSNPLKPQGWQLDIEGAAIVRLNIDHHRDVDVSDFRFGVPLTYGWGQWQYKIGYYHLSSHLGDEYLDRNPGAVRHNYVRDAMVVGASYNPTPAWRLYGEVAYAFFAVGGAEPWEMQFGVEYAQPGPTDIYGTPFFATNGHLREELDFGGDYTLQIGWLWRGRSGSTFRTGFQFLTGKSNLYQFYDESEEQYGWAIWYDF